MNRDIDYTEGLLTTANLQIYKMQLTIYKKISCPMIFEK